MSIGNTPHVQESWVNIRVKEAPCNSPVTTLPAMSKRYSPSLTAGMRWRHTEMERTQPTGCNPPWPGWAWRAVYGPPPVELWGQGAPRQNRILWPLVACYVSQIAVIGMAAWGACLQIGKCTGKIEGARYHGRGARVDFCDGVRRLSCVVWPLLTK